MEEWLRYGAPESLAYYLFMSPKSAKRLYFDVIPKATDEYLQQLEAYNRPGGANSTNPLDNPVWSVHAGAPPPAGSPISLSLLLNLVSASNASDRSILWGLHQPLPAGRDAAEPAAAETGWIGHAIHYYEDFVKPAKRFRAPDEKERAAFADLAARLRALPCRRLRRRRADPERGLCRRQGRQLRAPARAAFHGPLRGPARPDPGFPASAPSWRSSALANTPWR